MSNIRLFFKESLSLNLNSVLDRSQSHYLSKVMRIRTGENFSLFNQSGEWEAKVDNINKGIVMFTNVKKLRSLNNEKEIWLAFAPIKLNYLNLMIQKATEIGVTRFIPILTERTVVRKLNEKRINKIIIEASEQSNRLKVPSLDKLIKLDTFLKSNQNTNVIFGDLNTDNKKIDLIVFYLCNMQCCMSVVGDNITKTADMVASIYETASKLKVEVIFGGLGIELLPDISKTIKKTFITFKDLSKLV